MRIVGVRSDSASKRGLPRRVEVGRKVGDDVTKKRICKPTAPTSDFILER